MHTLGFLRFTFRALLLMPASVVMGATPAMASNILLNAGFETCTPGCVGEGVLPDNWVISAVTPDTWSNGGVNGLPPNYLGDFTGVTAHGGTNWVAGWASLPETFGQQLAVSLIPGATYWLSGYLHQAVRADLNVPGGYDIYLQSDAGNTLFDQVLIAHLGDTPDNAAWYFSTDSFVAPGNAGALGFLLFTPVGCPLIADECAYIGLDDLNLEADQVPEPSTLLLLALGLPAAIAALRRRRP